MQPYQTPTNIQSQPDSAIVRRIKRTWHLLVTLEQSIQMHRIDPDTIILRLVDGTLIQDTGKASPRILSFTLHDLPIDLPKIEKRMKEIIQRNKPFTKEVWSRDKAKEVFSSKGEKYKVELVDAIPEGQDLKIYYQGDWFDLFADTVGFVIGVSLWALALERRQRFPLVAEADCA